MVPDTDSKLQEVVDKLDTLTKRVDDLVTLLSATDEDKKPEGDDLLPEEIEAPPVPPQQPANDSPTPPPDAGIGGNVNPATMQPNAPEAPVTNDQGQPVIDPNAPR